MRLKNRVAVVTGGSGGLGSAICESFAAEGADVLVAYGNSSEQAGQTAARVERHGRHADLCQVDVGSEPQVVKMFEQAVARFGKIDIVVANAGIGRCKPLLETTLDDFEELIRVNLVGTYLTVRHGAAAMREQRSGKIITMSSVHGVGATHWTSLYEATKAGVANFTRGVAFDLGEYNIQANSIAPGAVPVPNDPPPHPDSELYKAWMRYTPSGRFGTPEDVAAAAVYLASHDSDWVTGQVLSVDGGITAGPLIPSFKHYGPKPKM
ncbi:MAG: glucose 1-dehydrogenase [Pirellulaceae bacterium]|nr:glucose 1-dehydrogenase [Pirellulaceae bacterium]